MELKKLVIVLICCLVLIFLLLFIRNVHNGTSGIAYTYDETKNRIIYVLSDEYKNEKRLLEIIEEIQNALQESDYDKIKSMMDPVFYDYKYESDYNLFAEAMKRYMEKEVRLSLQMYDEKPLCYLCSVVVYGSKKVSTINMMVTKSGDAPYQIMWDDIASLNAYHIEVAKEEAGLKSTLLYSATSDKAGYLVVEIENTGKERINYLINRSKITDSTKEEFFPDKLDNRIQLKPGEKRRITLVFSNGAFFLNPKEKLEFTITSRVDQQDVANFTIFLNNVAI